MKKEAKKIQGILRGLGDEISLGHCYELIARMSGNTSWKSVAKTSKKESSEKPPEKKKIKVNLDGIVLSDTNGRAEWLLRFFREGERNNGDTYYYLEDHTKKEVAQEIVRACHRDMLPDDYKFKFIHECLLVIADVTDGNYEDIHMEPNVYTSELLKWLSSNLNRIEYIDEASEQVGKFDSFANQLMCAQQIEKEEILHILLHVLSKESTYQDMRTKEVKLEVTKFDESSVDILDYRKGLTSYNDDVHFSSMEYLGMVSVFCSFQINGKLYGVGFSNDNDIDIYINAQVGGDNKAIYELLGDSLDENCSLDSYLYLENSITGLSNVRIKCQESLTRYLASRKSSTQMNEELEEV